MIILSRGKCGDLIAQCCLAYKKYLEKGQKLRLYCREHKPFRKGQLEFIEPLLKLQPYVQKVGWTDKICDVEPGIPQLQEPSVQKARELAQKYNYYSAWWVDDESWWRQVGKPHRQTDLRYRIPYAYNEYLEQSMPPWIQVPECEDPVKEPYIVLAAVPRYRCCSNFSALNLLKDKYRILYLGHPQDYEDFGKGIAQYYPVKDSVHAAQIIKGASLFVGTQTLFTWLAQAMGVDRIVSVSQVFQDTHMRCTQGFKGAFVYPAQLALMLNSWRYAHGVKPSVGYVIGTYGSPAYIDLQLALHKGLWKHDVLVSDDGSGDSVLRQVCAKWDAPLVGSDLPRLGHQRGDRAVYTRGFEHFRQKDWMVKMSRRFVWKKDLQATMDKYIAPMWKPCLSAWWVAKPQLQGKTVTTSCIAFNTASIPGQVIRDFNTHPIEGGYYMERMVCDILQQYYGAHPFAEWKQIYTGTGRCITCDDVLWRQKNTPQDYWKLSQSLGLPWDVKDFQDIIVE